MDSSTRSAPAQALIAQLGLNSQDIAKRLEAVDFQSDDAELLAQLTTRLTGRVDAYTETFFDYLSRLDDSKALFASPSLLKDARRQKTEHLQAMVSGSYGANYVEQRARLALLYSECGISTRSFLGAFNHVLLVIARDLDQPGDGPRLHSLLKIAFFDIGIIVDVLMLLRQRVISQQEESIRELSTPVLQIRERMLLLPLIGVVDTHRARLVTENLLHAIRQRRAKVVVMDITGVATIDSRVSHHLLQTVSAAGLMGAKVIVTGVSAEVAQSLVALGIDLERFNTVGDLQEGVFEAERLLGYRLVKDEDKA